MDIEYTAVVCCINFAENDVEDFEAVSITDEFGANIDQSKFSDNESLRAAINSYDFAGDQHLYVDEN